MYQFRIFTILQMIYFTVLYLSYFCSIQSVGRHLCPRTKSNLIQLVVCHHQIVM